MFESRWQIKWWWLIPAVLLLLVAGLAARLLPGNPESRLLDNGARIDWQDCWFEVDWWRPVYCGRFTTAPLDVTGERAARVHRLPVVLVRARAWGQGSRPLLYIAGGPGGAAMLDAGSMPGWLAWLDEVAWSNDVVFYDQRGVGLAQPRLDCPELLQARRSLLPQHLDAATVGRVLRDAGQTCKQRIEAAGHDFSAYSTRANARDAADLMAAVVPGARWDLYGISYGTRVALDLMRLIPERLHAAVLDSVYPPQIQFELVDPWLLERVLGLIGRVCGLVAQCDYGPAQMAELLQQALQRLQQQPLRIKAKDPQSGAPLDVVYGAEDFAWLLFGALYRWDHLAELPALIEAVAEGRHIASLDTLVQDNLVTQLDTSFSDAVASAVDCNDAYPLSAEEMTRMMARFERVRPLIEHDWAFGYCRFWKAADAGSGFREPVRSNVPALLLSGEFDPVTPPQWAEESSKLLKNSQVFQFPGIGHGVLDSHECALELVQSFLSSPLKSDSPVCLSGL